MSYVIITLDNPRNAAGVLKADIETFRRICDASLKVLEDLTPVDTGFCRSQWSYEIDSEGDFATFYCTCPYSSYLNRDPGWSKQAPHGMTGPFFKTYLPAIAKRLLRDPYSGRFR
jgi:hypothetical protein